MQRQQKNQIQPAPIQLEDQQKPDPKGKEKIEGDNLLPDKALNIICYNCGEPGHFSVTCVKPKVCFICFREDHLAGRLMGT
jgi:hypothetical protein